MVNTPPPDFQNVSFDWSVEKFHCQINVVGSYVLISKMNFFKIFSHTVVLRGRLFCKSNMKRFSSVCIAWHKHSSRWENSWQFLQTLDFILGLQTFLNSTNPSHVHIRLCKHRKPFLLLKCKYNTQIILTAADLNWVQHLIIHLGLLTKSFIKPPWLDVWIKYCNNKSDSESGFHKTWNLIFFKVQLTPITFFM